MKLPRGYKLSKTRFGLHYITNTKGVPLVYGLTEESTLAALNILRNGEVLSSRKVTHVDL